MRQEIAIKFVALIYLSSYEFVCLYYIHFHLQLIRNVNLYAMKYWFICFNIVEEVAGCD